MYMEIVHKFLLLQICSTLIVVGEPTTKVAGISSSPEPHGHNTAVARTKISFAATKKSHKAKSSRNSTGISGQANALRRARPHRAPNPANPASFVASSSKKGRRKNSNRVEKVGHSDDSQSSVKLSPRRRRRSIAKLNKVSWTSSRRRRSILPTARQAGISISTKTPSVETIANQTATPIAPNSGWFTGSVRGTMGTILLHLRTQFEDGSTTVLFLCALLGFGVLVVGALVLCAGMADDSHHSPNDPDHHPFAPTILHPQGRYSVESQPRPSFAPRVPPVDQARPSLSAPGQPRPSLSAPGQPQFAPTNAPLLPPVQMSSNSLPTPQPKPKQKEKTAKREDNSRDIKDAKASEHLCPSLVVPSGMEFVFAVREDLDNTRQELNFNIVDLKGAPLSRVVVSEKGNVNSAGCGIFLQTLTRMPLAMVDMKTFHDGSSKSPLICRPNGEVFGQLKHDESGRYLLKNKAGKGLLIFHGDFSEKAVNVMNTVGKLVCATERCVVDFDSAPHYQVRIAPYVDAGLVICGLLTIDKLEAKNERSP